MQKTRRSRTMLIPTAIMGVLAVTLFFVTYTRGAGRHITGLRTALNTTIQIFPLLIFSFMVAGLVQALLSPEALSKWIGEQSGIRGILIGTVAGGLTPGGPYVSLPIAAGMIRSGASIGTMVAFLTGWSLWAVNRLPMEVGILGWKLAFIRVASTFFFPPIAGLIAQAAFHGVK